MVCIIQVSRFFPFSKGDMYEEKTFPNSDSRFHAIHHFNSLWRWRTGINDNSPEIAAIQTFPEHYKFHGNRRSIQKQIGNAVPCLLGEKMVSHLISHLN